MRTYNRYSAQVQQHTLERLVKGIGDLGIRGLFLDAVKRDELERMFEVQQVPWEERTRTSFTDVSSSFKSAFLT